MGAGRPLVGRTREKRIAAEALRAKRSVLLSGPARSGRSRLLAAIVEAQSRPTFVVETRAGVVTVRSGVSDRRALVGAEDVRDVVAEVEARDGILVVDDIDLLPDAAAAALIDIVGASDAVLLTALAPRHEVARRSIHRWELLRPLVEDADLLTIAVGPLTLPETATLGNALRESRHGVGPADDAWMMALHHLSAGSPALVDELIEVAAVRGRMHAVCPIEPFADLLPGGLVETLTRMLAPLDARDRRLLGIVFELGAVPLRHVGSVVPSDVLARLHDGNLVVASVEAGSAAVSPLLARVVHESAPRDEYREERRDIAHRLLDLLQHGDALTPAEEVFCARFAGPVEAAGPLAGPLAAVLPRAALSLARSGVPRDALAIIARVLDDGPDLRASAALILARIALEDHTEAELLLRTLPEPVTAAERELALHVYVRTLCATCAGSDAARDRLQALVRWAPDDGEWRVRVEQAVAMLSLPNGASFAERALGPQPVDAMRPDATILDDALQAALAASRGDAARARALLRGRQATHGWDVESDLTVFLLHAYAMLMIGEDLVAIESGTRRRLLSARWDDRQDEVAVLALLDASVQLLRRRPDVAIASLQIPRIAPPESLRIWFDAMRAVAFIARGDLVHAAEALERVYAASTGWACGSFSLLRETVCARFEVANRRLDAAAARAHRAIVLAERRMPILLPSLLSILADAGVPLPQVRERAVSLAERFDLAPLRTFVDELLVAARVDAQPSRDLLTSREREVVDLAVTGASNAQIARRLGLSVRTVESHLHHARTRLGMSRHERFGQDVRATRPLARH
ncbi:DNA-binding CsgD family transcriptional regulator [Microbacterium proteolyticum]|uniref:DNA-binding CsgD family transcriptional regulator n=1 Tax=Microbacterium proteolyticum TaxID=1572644 RepID=A0A7W5CGD5_9MICO|nr:helix-turn-helix transcriptional regulator [Microbacterium proteolyticum]MBB3156779.1 DNA-binding CsgD family transcriptional regulator [Microbacterium proteolyticum]